ncbi:MAG: FIST N-terminal domain-containing protein [Polyangiaceae bacterium]|jgi:methyl-accepting chemotaxis protein
MGTKVGTGASAFSTAKIAVAEAVRKAYVGLGGAKPNFGFLFASPDLALADLLAIAREITQAEIVGCTSAGEITEAGLIHGGVAIMLVASDATIDMRFATGLKSDPEKVARELSSNLAAAKKAAAAHERRSLTTVLLTDGLAGTGERLVNELYERRVQSGTQIVGGAAGDEGRFAATWVGSGAGASSDSAVALHIFSESPWGIGVDHGLRPTTKQMRVTMAEGNVVHEIDGQPAFAAYQRHAAARNVRLTPENASPYLIANELGVHFFERIGRARAPLSVGPNGSLVCAAEVPKGSMVSILDGEPDSMILAAQAAAKAARASVHGPVAGVLLFDCVCRGMILKDAFRLEVEAIRTTFPGAPIAGLLTYGEIARSHDRLNGWNNATAVVVAIPA